jgi:hypothetical protein
MTTHAPERTRAPIAALRLLHNRTGVRTSARLALDTLTSLRKGFDGSIVAAARNGSLHIGTVVVTARASLMKSPG